MYNVLRDNTIGLTNEFTDYLKIFTLQKYLTEKSCWGYEEDCEPENAFSIPHCPGDHKGWVATKEAQIDTFYAQGDFGYIRDQRREMKLICEPLFVVITRIKLLLINNLY